MKRITRNNFDPSAIMRRMEKAPYPADEANRLLEAACHAWWFIKKERDAMLDAAAAITKIGAKP